MTENFISSIGGFNSWQFAVLVFGCLIIGAGLFAWKTYLIPILYFGDFLLFLYVSDEVNKAMVSYPEMAGAISAVPMIFLASVLIIPFAVKNQTSKRKEVNDDAGA